MKRKTRRGPWRASSTPVLPSTSVELFDETGPTRFSARQIPFTSGDRAAHQSTSSRIASTMNRTGARGMTRGTIRPVRRRVRSGTPCRCSTRKLNDDSSHIDENAVHAVSVPGVLIAVPCKYPDPPSYSPSTDSLSLFHPAVTQNSIRWNPARHPKYTPNWGLAHAPHPSRCRSTQWARDSPARVKEVKRIPPRMVLMMLTLRGVLGISP